MARAGPMHAPGFLLKLTDRELIAMMLCSVKELQNTNDMSQEMISESFRLLNIADKISAARVTGD
jgi:DNA repair protein RadC